MRGLLSGDSFLAADGAVGLLQAVAPSSTTVRTRRERRIMGSSQLKEPHFYRRA